MNEDEERRNFVYELVDLFPVLRPMLNEHLEDMEGEMLPYVFVGNVMLFLVANSDESYVEPILMHFEEKCKSADKFAHFGTRNLIIVGFLEMIPAPWEEPKGFWSRLGPVLYEEAKLITGIDSPETMTEPP